MRHPFPLLPAFGLCLFFAAMTSGCGGDEQTTVDNSPAGKSDARTAKAQNPTENDRYALTELPVSGSNSKTLPTASIDNSGKDQPLAKAAAKPKEGTAEWHLREITTLRLRPFPKTDDLAEQKTHRRERNLKIVDLATRAIALAHKDPLKERIFNVAVHHLMDAERQLALQGNSESIEALFDHAASLYERDPGSKAAAEAAYILAEFAHTNAQRYASQEPRWLQEFARQARLFATNFPQDEGRAVALLIAAGQSCELHRMTDEAIGCYSTIQQKFPENRRAGQTVSVLRRLNLKGKPVDLAGPTIDGGYVRIDDFRGKVVLVVFWATNAKPFLDCVPQLKTVVKTFDTQHFAVLGVNFDEDEPLVGAFVEKNAVDWPQIFFTDAKRRGWNNPIATYYGVRNIPMFWLIDEDGNLVDAMIDLNSLESQVRVLLDRNRSVGN